MTGELRAVCLFCCFAFRPRRLNSYPAQTHLLAAAATDPTHRPNHTHARTVVNAQNALTAEVLAQCETRGRFKALFTDLYK